MMLINAPNERERVEVALALDFVRIGTPKYFYNHVARVLDLIRVAPGICSSDPKVIACTWSRGVPAKTMAFNHLPSKRLAWQNATSIAHEADHYIIVDNTLYLREHQCSDAGCTIESERTNDFIYRRDVTREQIYRQLWMKLKGEEQVECPSGGGPSLGEVLTGLGICLLAGGAVYAGIKIGEALASSSKHTRRSA